MLRSLFINLNFRKLRRFPFSTVLLIQLEDIIPKGLNLQLCQLLRADMINLKQTALIAIKKITEECMGKK